MSKKRSLPSNKFGPISIHGHIDTPGEYNWSCRDLKVHGEWLRTGNLTVAKHAVLKQLKQRQKDIQSIIDQFIESAEVVEVNDFVRFDKDGPGFKDLGGGLDQRRELLYGRYRVIADKGDKWEVICYPPEAAHKPFEANKLDIVLVEKYKG
jgi:hypothetical protein